jgi:hypothetical protein
MISLSGSATSPSPELLDRGCHCVCAHDGSPGRIALLYSRSVLRRIATAAAPQPVLFVSQCQDADRLEQFYAKVTPLGIFVPDDPVPRGFAAFTLEAPRGAIGTRGAVPERLSRGASGRVPLGATRLSS